MSGLIRHFMSFTSKYASVCLCAPLFVSVSLCITMSVWLHVAIGGSTENTGQDNGTAIMILSQSLTTQRSANNGDYIVPRTRARTGRAWA